MNTRTEPGAGLCPVVEHAFTLLGKKWSGMVVHVLGAGPRRFSDLLHEVSDLSPRILTQRLKELESEHIVTRTVLPESPVRVEYELTDKGRALLPIMAGIADWAHAWAEEG